MLKSKKVLSKKICCCIGKTIYTCTNSAKSDISINRISGNIGIDNLLIRKTGSKRIGKRRLQIDLRRHLKLKRET